jgi:hypothetical protein
MPCEPARQLLRDASRRQQVGKGSGWTTVHPVASLAWVLFRTVLPLPAVTSIPMLCLRTAPRPAR